MFSKVSVHLNQFKNGTFSLGTHCIASNKVGTTRRIGTNIMATLKCGARHHKQCYGKYIIK